MEGFVSVDQQAERVLELYETLQNSDDFSREVITWILTHREALKKLYGITQKKQLNEVLEYARQKNEPTLYAVALFLHSPEL